MPEQTEAQKRAHKSYIAKFARLEIRTTVEQREAIQSHASSHGESVNGFIGRAISETMARDGADRPQEATGQPAGAGVALPSETLETAQRAAEAAGEATEQFISRAVETQAKQDEVIRKMGGTYGNQ